MAIDAGTIYSAVRIALDKLNGDIKAVESLYDQLGKSLGEKTKKTEKKVNESFDKMLLGMSGLFLAVGAYVKKSVSDFAAFEQSLANVQSVAKATSADMMLLEKAASEAGQTTKFSSKQAADAMYYLASAGFTARQSIDALDGVLALASATQADLAFTSETVASAISQFGLQAKDSLRVANVFAAGIAASQATIDKLAVSMRYVGPVAAAFDYSIESITGTLAILYNAGFEASQAGTALRGVLADLSNAASPANEKLKALGITFDQVNPAANSLVDVFKALNPIAQNGGKIMEIFGDRAGPAMIKLLSAGADEIQKYTDRVTGTNEAMDAAAIQNDTLQFALARLGKGFGSVGKSIAEEFAPGLKSGANSFADFLFKVKEMPAAIKILLGVLGAGVLAFTAITSAAGLFGVAIASIAAPVAIVVGSLSALAAASILLFKAYNQGSDNTIKFIKTQQELEENTTALKKSVDDYAEANKQLNDKTKTLNETEKQTLENRKKLAGLEIVANLQKTIESLDKLKKEYDKKNASISTYDINIKNAKKSIADYNKILADVKALEEKKITIVPAAFGVPGSGGNAILVKDAIVNINKAIDEQTKLLNNNTTAQAQATIAGNNANTSRQDTIDSLAAAVSLGNISLEQIQAFSLSLSLEVGARQRVLEKLKQDNDELEKNNDLKGGPGGTIELTSEEIKANDELRKTLQKTKEQLEDLNATELQKIENDRRRALQEINTAEASAELRAEAIKATNAYYDALYKKTEQEIKDKEAIEKVNEQIELNNEKLKLSEERSNKIKDSLLAYVEARKKQKEIDEEINDKANTYLEKLKQLTDKNYDAIEAERAKEEEAIRASGASEDATNAAIDSLNEYYDKLKEKEAFDEFVDNMKNLTTTVINGFNDILNASKDIAQIQADQEIAAIEKIRDAQLESIDAQQKAADLKLKSDLESLDTKLQAALEAAGVEEDAEKEKLQKQLQEALKKNDTEKAAEIEKEIKRLEIIQDFEDQKKDIENKALKDKEENEKKQIEIEKNTAKESAMIKYEADHAAWEADNWALAGKAILAEMQAWSSAPWPWNLAAIGFTTAGVAALIQKQKLTEPKPPAFEIGGIVLGSQQGTVIRAGENGYNDLILSNSPAGQKMITEVVDKMLERMDQRGAGVPAIINVMLDGYIIAQNTVRVINDGKLTIQARSVR